MKNKFLRNSVDKYLARNYLESIMDDKSQVPEILGYHILHQKNSFRRVKRWYKGVNLELGGEIHKGYSGLETVVETDVIIPTRVFRVV